MVSWGDDHWWITKPAQNEWRVLPRPDKAEGKDNDANSGEWRLLTHRALRPEPLPDCAFDLAEDTSADGTITIRLSARGQGRHRFTVRAGNLAISDLNQELDLKRDVPATAQWTATVVNAKAPWVVVVVPDGNLAQRREVTAKINQP